MMTVKNHKLSRRALLGGAGALGGAYWLNRPNSLPIPTAKAQDDAPPKRLVIFHTSQGTLRDIWAPKGTETDFEFGELQRDSLTKHIPDLLVMNGLSMLSNDVDPTSAASAHDAGCTHSLTAINRSGPSLPGGPSIDSFIASELAKQGAVTKLPSLELATWVLSGPLNVSYGADGSPIPFLCWPVDVYDRVFGDFIAPDDGGGNDKLKQREALLKWASAEYGLQAQHLSGNSMSSHQTPTWSRITPTCSMLTSARPLPRSRAT
jgi:hypothetical protein